MLSQFDELRDPEAPWLPCPMECGYVTSKQPCWCRFFGDRLSAMLVSAKTKPTRAPYANDLNPQPAGQIPLYSDRIGGIVLSPEHNRLLCSYRADGGTMGKTCIDPGAQGEAHPKETRVPPKLCVPGCYAHSPPDRFCDAGEMPDEGAWAAWERAGADVTNGVTCAFRPEHLKAMLSGKGTGRYNELVAVLLAQH